MTGAQLDVHNNKSSHYKLTTNGTRALKSPAKYDSFLHYYTVSQKSSHL